MLIRNKLLQLERVVGAMQVKPAAVEAFLINNVRGQEDDVSADTIMGFQVTASILVVGRVIRCIGGIHRLSDFLICMHTIAESSPSRKELAIIILCPDIDLFCC
jgi:hypothetical protein